MLSAAAATLVTFLQGYSNQTGSPGMGAGVTTWSTSESIRF